MAKMAKSVVSNFQDPMQGGSNVQMPIGFSRKSEPPDVAPTIERIFKRALNEAANWRLSGIVFDSAGFLPLTSVRRSSERAPDRYPGRWSMHHNQ
jgi:hypothetical protein